MTRELTFHVSELRALSKFLCGLADVASDRLSLTQAAFFLQAAIADAAGRPSTRTEIITSNRTWIRGSIRNSYRQLLEPSRVYPNALGWLRTVENPLDAREKVLRLTDKGREIVEQAIR